MGFNHELSNVFDACGVKPEDVEKCFDNLPGVLDRKTKLVEIIMNANTPEQALAVAIAYFKIAEPQQSKSPIITV